MHEDIAESFAKKRGELFRGSYINGLPIGLRLPNGVTIGESPDDSSRPRI